MKETAKVAYGEWIIGGIFFLLAMLLLTPVYDDYGYFILAMAAGQYSDFSFVDLHYMGFIGVNRLYKFLYHSVPGYSWMGLVLVLSNFFGLLMLLRTLRRVIIKNYTHKVGLYALQALFAVFYLENFWILSHTRFALLFCGIALTNLVFTDILKKREVLGWFLVFVWGMLHRPESSLGMLVLVSAGFLVYRFDPKFLFKRIFFPFAATAVLFTCITVDRLYTDIYIRRVEPEIEYKLMDKRVLQPSVAQTPADSVKYEAALIGMWFDTATLSPEYLRSILLSGVNLSAAHAEKVLVHILSFYGRYAFIPVWILVWAVWAGVQKRWRVLAKLLVFQTLTFGLLFGLDFNGLLVDGRHFLNLQLISLAISLFYFQALGNVPQTMPRWKTRLVFAVLLGAGVFSAYQYVRYNRMVTQSVSCYESFMRETENIYQNRIVVITLDNYNLLDHPFSVRNHNYIKNTYIMYDMFTFSLIPEYVDYLDRLCGCDASDPTIFYRWLAEREALYMAKPSRYTLTERFMYVIHGQKLHFDVDNALGNIPCSKQSHKKGFELRKVRVENP